MGPIADPPAQPSVVAAAHPTSSRRFGTPGVIRWRARGVAALLTLSFLALAAAMADGADEAPADRSILRDVIRKDRAVPNGPTTSDGPPKRGPISADVPTKAAPGLKVETAQVSPPALTVQAGIDPRVIEAGVPAAVTVTATVSPGPVPRSVTLMRLDGGREGPAAALHDDGADGDQKRGDRIYTARLTLTEPAAGVIRFRVAAQFARPELRAAAVAPASVFSGIVTLTVRAAPAPPPPLAVEAGIDPRVIEAGVPAAVTVTATVSPGPVPRGVTLMRLDGGREGPVAALHDDGADGDRKRGDRIYTARLTLTEPAAGVIRFRVAAQFARPELRAAAVAPASVLSPIVTLTVRAPQPPPTPPAPADDRLVRVNGLEFRRPPGWHVDRKDWPIALRNSRTRVHGGVLQRSMCEIEGTTAPIASSTVRDLIRKDLENTVAIQETRVGGREALEFVHTEVFSAAIVYKMVGVYVPGEPRGYKFFLSYLAHDPVERACQDSFREFVASVRFTR